MDNSVNIMGTPVNLDEIAIELVDEVHEDRSRIRNHCAKGFVENIDHVVFNGPAVIVFWKNKTKTVVKCADDDNYSAIAGFALCLLKAMLGNQGYHELCEHWLDGVYEADVTMRNARNSVVDDEVTKPVLETKSRLDILEEKIDQLKAELYQNEK